MTIGKNTGKRILLVEDNEKIMQGNKRMLKWEGYTIDTAVTLAEAYIKLELHRPDCIVLDIMLPDGSGLDFMKKLRESTDAGIPILLLTGLNAQEDILQGLKSGGDDYLTKPYDFKILLARIEALLRRSERVPERITKGRLTLDMSAAIAFMDRVDLLLTKKEFALLLIFVQNPERFIDREYLYEKVWKQPMTEDANALKSTIKRLRSKIEGSGWQIEWSRGEGYCFEKE
ncbi:response regulator transcription factor [Anaerovorax sp. IOR16]|uniref:response regulator transcription factor n=1 Tax=Anaerovorax sp. IOR16 TaxID=2773458 RepID=UPI0019CF5BD7|nr:response regulator transcription factor [Anaerovorax sp. IOR16]